MKSRLPYILGTVVVISIVFVAGFFVGREATAPAVNDSPTSVPCTNEALLCPDGSGVGREGPNCEFPECPGEIPPVKPE